MPSPPDVDPGADLYAFAYDEAAARLGVSRSTVERMVRAGHLRSVSVWGRPRITAAELRRYLDRLARPLSPIHPTAPRPLRAARRG